VARIAGVDLPKDKPIWVALQSIYGIGASSSQSILAATGIDPGLRVKELSEEQVGQIRDVLDKQYKLEGDLRREVQSNIKRLIEISCYRGTRHRMRLPVHGRGYQSMDRERAQMPELKEGPGKQWPVEGKDVA